jgi:hypothetical protein
LNIEVELDLGVQHGQSDDQGKSHVRILLSAPGFTKAVGDAIINAHKNANNIQIGKEEHLVALADGAQASVEQASNLASIGMVVDKIGIFVNIIDKTASVHAQVSVPGLSEMNDSSSASPICHTSLGHCVIGIQGDLKCDNIPILSHTMYRSFNTKSQLIGS